MASSANAAVVFSDNFNAENGGAPVLGTTSLTNFDVLLPNVDVIGNGPGGISYDFYPGQGLYLDLDGTTGATNATIATKSVFGPGSYLLTFLLGNNPGGGNNANTLTVSLGDFTSAPINTAGFPPLQLVNLAFTTTISGSLTFAQGGPADQQGSIIDDVQLSSVPEPASVLSMITGLAALGLRQFRRSRRK
jgi:hypothetical protein